MAGASPVVGAPSGKHPQATMSAVLGVLGLAPCFCFLAPVAWIMGARTVREIDASGGTLAGRGAAVAGKAMGVVGTLIAAAFLLLLVWVAVGLSSM